MLPVAHVSRCKGDHQYITSVSWMADLAGLCSHPPSSVPFSKQYSVLNSVKTDRFYVPRFRVIDHSRAPRLADVPSQTTLPDHRILDVPRPWFRFYVYTEAWNVQDYTLRSSSIGVTKYEAHTLRFSLMSGSTVRLLLAWPLEGIGVVQS